MAYRNLSHTVVTISHKAKLNGIYETKVWDKFYISWLVVFILLKGIFQLKQELKELFSAQPWDMEIYPMAISQSEWDKFS